MYLVSVILFIVGVCAIAFADKWYIPTACLFLAVIAFLSAITVDVRSHEYNGEPKNFGKKNPYEPA